MNDPDDEEDELKIVAHKVVGKKVEKLTNLYEVLDIAHFIFDNVRMSDYAQQYKVRLIRNTRPHRVQGRAARTVKEYIKVGISPRVNFHLEAVARTFAFFNGDTIGSRPTTSKRSRRMSWPTGWCCARAWSSRSARRRSSTQVIRDMEVPPWK